MPNGQENDGGIFFLSIFNVWFFNQLLQLLFQNILAANFSLAIGPFASSNLVSILHRVTMLERSWRVGGRIFTHYMEVKLIILCQQYLHSIASQSESLNIKFLLFT